MNACGLAADPYGDPTVTSYPFILQARKSSDLTLGIFSNCLLQGSHGALLICEGKPSTSSTTHHLCTTCLCCTLPTYSVTLHTATNS